MIIEATDLFSQLGIPAPTQPIDLEAWRSQYLPNAIAETRAAYWRSNTPPKFQDFNPNHPGLAANAAAIAKVVKWQAGEIGLLLSGSTGLGKTRSLYALARRLLCDEHRDVAIWSAQEFFSTLQERISYGRDEATAFIKRQSERPIFLLDDYGQQALLNSREDWAQQWFFHFLDKRRGLGLPLLLSTNLTAEKIAGNRGSLHGDPLLTRLLDVAEPVKFR